MNKQAFQHYQKDKKKVVKLIGISTLKMYQAHIYKSKIRNMYQEAYNLTEKNFLEVKATSDDELGVFALFPCKEKSIFIDQQIYEVLQAESTKIEECSPLIIKSFQKLNRESPLIINPEELNVILDFAPSKKNHIQKVRRYLSQKSTREYAVKAFAWHFIRLFPFIAKKLSSKKQSGFSSVKLIDQFMLKVDKSYPKGVIKELLKIHNLTKKIIQLAKEQNIFHPKLKHNYFSQIKHEIEKFKNSALYNWLKNYVENFEQLETSDDELSKQVLKDTLFPPQQISDKSSGFFLGDEHLINIANFFKKSSDSIKTQHSKKEQKRIRKQKKTKKNQTHLKQKDSQEQPKEMSKKLFQLIPQLILLYWIQFQL